MIIKPSNLKFQYWISRDSKEKLESMIEEAAYNIGIGENVVIVNKEGLIKYILDLKQEITEKLN